MKYLRK